MAKLQLGQFTSSPAAPPSGYALIYFKTDNVLYIKGSDNIEHAIGMVDGLTDLHGDVVASGPGDAFATIITVGGRTAAEIAQAVVDTQAATSANTVSVIVKRDSSGNVFVNQINGVVVQSHASRHLPNGADPITTAAPTSDLGSNSSNSTGSANSLSRSDHSHAIDTAVPVTQTPDQSNAIGTSASLSKSDHIHNIPTDTPVDTGSSNSQGSSSKFAKADHVHNVSVLNGIQNVAGILSPVYGSSPNTVTQGNDSRLSIANLIRVKQNPGAGEFSSVVAALASITTAGPMNPFVIKISPGFYPESQIVMKSYVSITSDTNQEAILVPTNPDQVFVIAADDSSMSNIVLSEATGANGVLVQYTGGADSSTFLMKDCVFGNATTLVYARGNNLHETILSIQNCITFPDVVFTTGFKVDSSGSVRSRLVLSGLFINTGHSAFNPTDYFVASGDASKILLSDSFIIGSFATPSGNGLRLLDGSDVTVVGSNFINMNRCVWLENTGSAPNIAITGVHTDSNNFDIVVDHPTATGSIDGAFQASNSSIASPNISFFTADPSDGITFTGDLNFGPTFAERENVTDLVLKGPTMGLYSGGELSDGSGFIVNVSIGNGYVVNGSGVKRVSWNNTSITLSANSSVYLFFNSSGSLASSGGIPDTTANILLGRVATNGTGIEFIDDSPLDAKNYGNLNDDFVRHALGAIFESGCIVTENVTPFHLNVSSGTYYFGDSKFTPSSSTNILFDTFYQNGSGSWTIGSSHLLDSNHYDNGTGTLASITSSYYARHALYLVGQGINQKYLFVYAQVQYPTLVQAENGVLPLPPTYFEDGVVLISSIIVQRGASNITEIRDERPVVGFKASGTNSAIIHGNLLGLSADDHKQYLLVDGSRPMSGSLDMGGNNIGDVGTVDGVVVHAHGSRHLPNGADPLTTAAPTGDLTASTANATGIANSLARSDHSHAIDTAVAATQIPDQSNAAGTSANLSRADHVHNIPSAVPVQIGTSNAQGSSASFSLSDHVHSHGNQTTPSLHAIATSLANGFMSSADKSKLDAIVTAGAADAQILISNGSTFNPYSLSGDVSLTDVGAVSINVGAVTDTKGSLANKPAVALASTSNQTLSGLPTIDGVATVVNMLVLLTAQTTGSQNGPWQAQAGAWTRPSWYPSGGTTQAFQFITVLIRLGTTYQGSTWRMTTPSAITIDTASTTWVVTPHALNANTVTGTLPSAQLPAFSGDVATTAGSSVTTIQPNVVDNTKLAQMPTLTIKGNNTGSTANVIDLTETQVATMLNSYLAKVDLSNLTSPTSINQSLLPNADSTFNLGGATSKWATGYFSNLKDGGNTLSVDVVNRRLHDNLGAQSITWSARNLVAPNGSAMVSWDNTGASIRNLFIIGLSGSGYVNYQVQASNPATPSSGYNLFADSSGRLAWKGTNGFVRTLDGTGNTADRVYTLPDTTDQIATAQMTTAFKTKVVALTDAANISTDVSLGNVFTVTLGGNRNLSAPTNSSDGQKIIYRITQDATGGRALTFDSIFTFGLDIISFVPSTGANKIDYLGCIYNAATSKWNVIAVSKGF